MRISVIVPVLNEADSIRALLDSLLGQTRPPDEIVITDGGSTDGTPDVVEEYARRGAPVRLLREPGALPGRGRNVAASQAAHEWLAFIDAGIRPAQDWLERLVERAESSDGAEVVYGAWQPVTDTLFTECAAIAYVPPPAEVDGCGMMRPRFIASSLMRREVWRAAGGFPEHLRSAEDLLFMGAVEEAKFRTVYAPEALVHWQIQPTLWRTFRRFATYSRNNIRAGLWASWQRAVFRRYAVILICALPAAVFGPRWLPAVLAPWLLLLAARAVAAIRRNRRAYPAGLARNAARLIVLVPLVAALDAAALLGSVDWFLRDKLHLIGGAVSVGDST